MEDTFQTIAEATPEVLFKEKQSKFFGYAFPVQSEEEVKACLEKIKKQHPQARHWCYAYQIGFPNIKWRANDDGEPNHTAGTPILGQI
jgi:putative IMPACT (imprinted ancient) family translation regulator